MVHLKKRQYAEEDFQMAPMIDMVFLLLVFFMCVSTLAQADKNTPLDLPDSAESKVPEDLSDRGTLSIDKNGFVYMGSRPVSLETVKERIGESLEKDPKLRIMVRADRDTTYGDIRKALRACAEAGAYEIVYATYQTK